MIRMWPLWMVCACVAEPEEAPASQDKSVGTVDVGNVLVLVADDMGIDQMGLYGRESQAPATPNLDRLAESGVRFSAAYSMPSCSPARAALLTGRHGRRTGIGRPVVATEAESVVLDPQEFTLGDLMQAVGGHTSAVGKWHLGTYTHGTGLRHPLRLGFDWFAGSQGQISSTTLAHGSEEVNYFRWEKNTNGSLDVQHVYATTDTVDDAIERMRTMPEPWLLYVAFHAPHTPLHRPPEALLSQALPTHAGPYLLYDAMVESMDTEIGRLLDSMEPATRARTTTLFLGDNGTPGHAIEEFGYARSKSTLFEGGTRVPFLVEGHGVDGPGVVDAMIHVVDVLPTVADLLGVDLHALVPEATFDGESFLPWLRSADAPGRRYMYTEKFTPNGPGPYVNSSRAVRGDAYKLRVDDVDGTEKLYELDADGIEIGLPISPEHRTPGDEAALGALRRELDRLRVELGG